LAKRLKAAKLLLRTLRDVRKGCNLLIRTDCIRSNTGFITYTKQTLMKRFTSFFFALAISAGAVFAQSTTESASAGNTKIALQQTDNGYEVISVESTGTSTKAAETKEAAAPAAAAGKSCCSKKGASASAAACSGKEAEAAKAASCGASGASASAGAAKPACCASGSHAAAATPKNPN